MFLFDDDEFDYAPLLEPTSQQQMYGYHAVAWNTDFSITGYWQGHNVLAMTTDSPLFDIHNEPTHSQGIQVQHTWNAHEQMPWLWTTQGQSYELTTELDYSVPVSWGNNLRQVVSGYRFEDVSSEYMDTGHGLRLWVQFGLFDNLYPDRPISVWHDAHTGEDIAVQIPLGQSSPFFDFSGSTTGIRNQQFNEMEHVEISMSRQQFTDLLIYIENQLDMDIQNESGYWSMIQAMPASVEMASFPVPQWGIGDHGAIQMFAENLMVYGSDV